MTGSLVTEWLTVTTGLFSFFFLLSAFAWILSRDHKINDLEKQHGFPEETTYYVINDKNNNNDNITDSKNSSIKTTDFMPTPMARAVLSYSTNIKSIAIENEDCSMLDDRTILNSSILRPPLPSIPFFKSPLPPTPCMLGPATRNHLTWWLHRKINSTPEKNKMSDIGV